MKRVPVFDYLEQYEGIKDEILGAIERVLESGRLILGTEVEAFEAELSRFLGGKGGSVGVSSGTDALVVALMSLGVGPGDEVITVANTAVPTVSAIRSAGAMPVFCDVEPRSCLMDLEDLPRRITALTKAVVPVHLFGNVVDVVRIRTIIGGRDIKIVEDCAQAQGATLGDRMAGTLGDAAAFSFYPTKTLGAYGDAGLCYSSDPNLVSEMRRVRVYGFETNHFSSREGVNARLDELQAAILRVKLKHLPRFLERRRALAAHYHRLLTPKALPVEPGVGVRHCYHLFVIQVSDRDRVRTELAARGVETGIHYPTPIHLMQGYRFLGYKVGSLPHTEAVAASVLSLPIYPELSTGEVERVAFELNRVLE